MFHIVHKDGGYFIIVKNGDPWSYNMMTYKTLGGAKIAVSNIYRAIQRKIDKELLG